MALSPTRCRSPTLPRLPLDSSMAITRYNRRGRIGPSFRGKLYEYESNGRRIIASWPKPRGKPVSEKQALSQKAFKEVAEAVKRTAAEVQNFHRLAAAGTPMLPRDTLFAALYGNGPTIKLYDGRIIKPMANKYLSSTVLDAIGWQEGTILYRGANTWEELIIGTPGQVLTVSLEGRPIWADQGGGGGGSSQIWALPSSYAAPGDLYSTFATYIEPSMATKIVKAIPALAAKYSGEWSCSVWRQHSGILDERIAVSDTIVGEFSFANPPVFDLAMDERLDPSFGYLLAFTRRVNGALATWKSLRTYENPQPYPRDTGMYGCSSNAELAVGTVMSNRGAVAYCSAFAWEF